MVSTDSLISPNDKTHILLGFLLRFPVKGYFLIVVVGSKVYEVGELSFGHGGDSGGGWAVARLTCISNLEHYSVYKSQQSSKYKILFP